MLHREVKPHAAINTATLYKTDEETSVAPTNILQVSLAPLHIVQHECPSMAVFHT